MRRLVLCLSCAGLWRVHLLEPLLTPSPPHAQGEVIARLQQLLPSKAGRRIVYQQKEDGSSA